MVTVRCAKCGAPNEIDPGVKFMRCRYCDSQMYLDKSGAGFFYILPYFINEEAARQIFTRWAAGPQTAKNLENTAQIVAFKKQYFPVYMFKRNVGGREVVYVAPARSTTLPGMRQLKVPAGDIKIFDQNYDYGDAELVEPNIEMMAYLETLPGERLEQALVYFPIYIVEYSYMGLRYINVIDGSSGEIFTYNYPPREQSAYYAVGAAGFGMGIGGGLMMALGMMATGAALVLVGFVAITLAGYYVASHM